MLKIYMGQIILNNSWGNHEKRLNVEKYKSRKDAKSQSFILNSSLRLCVFARLKKCA
ncbi:hypothetical protein FLCH110379_11540 [Flavobacterium chungbukense]